jgi:hypothetical protein
MIVEVMTGTEERPEARVVHVDDLSSLHLALGQVTDDEATEVLERSGEGRQLGLALGGRRQPAGACGERRERLTSAVGDNFSQNSLAQVIVVTPPTSHDVAVLMTTRHGIRQ